MGNVYFVESKADDFGADVTELVETTLANAKKYYHFREVKPEHVEVLKAYLPFTAEAKEKLRSDEERFYGN